MITTSPDGQWAVVRRGREVVALASGAGPATGKLELPTDGADMVLVGPPSVLAVVTRGDDDDGAPCNRVVLYQPPYLDAVARADLEVPMRIAGLTGSRLILVSLDGKAVTVVRVAGRALALQTLDPGSPVEFAVGLDRNQVLFGLLKKLESWDAVSGRPVLRMQLPLLPPPRTVGPAHGFFWQIRGNSDDILVCRLSDGRPFRHQIGVTIDEVIYHPASPLLILVTARGLVRLHCFAHSLTVIDSPWRPGTDLAQLVVGEDISLLGMTDGDDEPWRVPIGGAGAPAITLDQQDGPGEPVVTAADKLRAMRERQEAAERPGTERGVGGERPGTERGERAEPAERDRGERGYPSERTERTERAEPADRAERAPRAERTERAESADRAERAPRAERTEAPAEAQARPPSVSSRSGPPRTRNWRDPIAAFGAELVRGSDAEPPGVAVETELGQLAHRLALPATARRALIALYGAYLVGEPSIALAQLAHALGDWTEPLGQGELGALAMLRRRGGRVALRGAVTDVLDGAGPRAIRVIGAANGAPRAGATRLARDGRSDAALEAELASQLGRIAVIEGGAALALLEARLHGATAVALAPPPSPPRPWPRDAGLVVVAEAAAPAWVAALPAITAA